MLRLEYYVLTGIYDMHSIVGAPQPPIDANRCINNISQKYLPSVKMYTYMS